MMKLGILAIVTLALVASTTGQPYSRPSRLWWMKNFLCSNIWIKDNGAIEMERIPDMRQLVGDMSVDVGTCPAASCQLTTYIHNYECEEDRGHVCPVTETRTATHADFGTHEYEYVTKCICCKDEGIAVNVRTFDSVSGDRLAKMRIHINNVNVGLTDASGELETNVKTTEQLVVKAEDSSRRMYLNAVKVVDIPDGFRGPIDIDLPMNKKAVAVDIDSREETTLSLSKDPSNSNNGYAQIVIDSYSFMSRGSRRPYRGIVKASVTYLNMNEDPEEALPGRFQTSVEGTEESLISDGVANFEFTEPNGNALSMRKPIKFIVRKDMRMWNLNEATGLWEPTGDSPSNRGKRQVTLTDEYLVNINNGQWVNIDKIPGAPRCYFKGRIFDAVTGTEIQSSATASFRPHILAYTNQNQRLRMYAGYTSSPSDTCFEVRCPDVSDPDDALTGFINMTSTETVSIGGLNVPHISYLPPRNLAGYTLPIQNRHSAVQYAIAPNGLDVFVNFVSNAAGPFYTVKNACENSPVQQPAFHFFKPALPSYIPTPNDTDICTARIAFRDQWNFYNYTANQTSIAANVTAISVWSINGTNYYYTDTVQLQESTNASDYFVYACLSYRCSEVNETTTVYLDLQVPNITVFYNRTTGPNETTEYNYTMSEFSCYGNCHGPLCGNTKENAQGGGALIGSFDAPENVGTGPDFYDSEDADCDDSNSTNEFAYEFSCYSQANGDRAQ